MLTSVKKFKHITGQFIEPYFIQTDSSGMVIAICEKCNALFPDFNIGSSSQNNLFEIFSEMGYSVPAFSNDIEKNGFPKVFDLYIHSKIERDLVIRWIATPVSFDDNNEKNGWQLTGIQAPGPKNQNHILTIPDTAQLQKEKNLSDSIINSMPGIFYLFDHTGKFLRWNNRLETVSGYNYHEISNMSPVDFFTDKEKAYITGRIEKVFTEGISDAEANLFTKNGDEVPHYFTGQLITYENKPCLIGMGIDVSERKKAEEKIKISNERYMLATKATNDTIWDWDMKSGSCFWGEGFYTQFGYHHFVEMNAKTFWETHIHPVDQQRVINSKESFIINKTEGFWSEEYRFQKANGDYSIVSDRGFLVFDKEKNVVRVIGSMQDITDKKNMEKKLLQQELSKHKLIAQAMINAQEKERAEIGQELHDNVNQILSTGKLYIELAKSSEDQKNNLLEFCEENINNAINEIRKISRALVPSSIEDLGLTESINDLVEHINSTKSINVEFYTVCWSDEIIGSTQKLTLFRIIQEQVNNVLKHSGAKNLIIELEMDEYENSIKLNISDDGKGFDPEKIKTKKSLGFSNIFSRTHLFDGKISIVSAPEKGCKLNVQIPLHNSQLNKLYE